MLPDVRSRAIRVAIRATRPCRCRPRTAASSSVPTSSRRTSRGGRALGRRDDVVRAVLSLAFFTCHLHQLFEDAGDLSCSRIRRWLEAAREQQAHELVDQRVLRPLGALVAVLVPLWLFRHGAGPPSGT